MIKQFFSILLLTLASHAQAEIITTWNLLGAAGDEVSINPDSGAVAAHVTGSPLTRGAGIQAKNAVDTFNSKDWDDGTADEYFSFGFTVEDGFSVDLTSLAITLRASNKGPDDLGLFYSGDSFATRLFNFDQSGTSDNTQLIDLSLLQGLTGSLEFRILALNNHSADGGTITAGGTLRIANPLTINGSVQAVPEPSSVALLLLGLSLLLIRFYRFN